MWLEILLASVLGFLIYWFVSRDKEETLPLGDGWWGPGAKPTAREDESIRPFKVETSEEEINVRRLPLKVAVSGTERRDSPFWDSLCPLPFLLLSPSKAHCGQLARL